MREVCDTDLTFDRRLQHWLPPVGDNCFRIWASPLVADFGTISARGHNHHYPAHIHDCVEMIWLHAGQADLFCRKTVYRLSAGDMCMIAPNELHSTAIAPGGHCTFTIVHVPSSLYWPLVHHHAGTGRQTALEPVRVIEARRLNMPLVSLLESTVPSNDAGHIYSLLQKLVEDALTLPQRYSGSRPEKTFWHPAVMQAREALAENMEEGVNITDMAAMLGLNVRYFISLFKDGTGLSPHQYHIALRVERARHLIQGFTTPLSEVAVSAGFSDQSHLNRHFKRNYGYTPGAFRQILNPI